MMYQGVFFAPPQVLDFAAHWSREPHLGGVVHDLLPSYPVRKLCVNRANSSGQSPWP